MCTFPIRPVSVLLLGFKRAVRGEALQISFIAEDYNLTSAWPDHPDRIQIRRFLECPILGAFVRS